MDAKSGPEFSKQKSIYSKEGCTSKDGGQWHETQKDRRDHGKNRERSRDDSCRSSNGKSRDNFRHEENRAFEEQPSSNFQQPLPQQPISFQAVNYANNNVYGAAAMSGYDMMAPMNSSAVRPFNGMPTATNNLQVNQTPLSISMTAHMNINEAIGPGMNSYTYVGMPQGNTFGVMGVGQNYCQYNIVNGQENFPSPTEVVQLTKGALYPPNLNTPKPTTRHMPNGCKTAFVGGLPEGATEEIMIEIFKRFGTILAIRMHKKNFCHIRFADEATVMKAIYFSGYRLEIENKDGVPFTGRLHVDFSEARDDSYEYSCQQRVLKRENRHRERMEQDSLRPPTPPPVAYYSGHEATLLGKKLQEEKTFHEAVFIFVTWLERGECNKRNASTFFSMLQSIKPPSKFIKAKQNYKEEQKLSLYRIMQDISLYFNDVSKIYDAACLQKVWDQFTKSQRSKIEEWKKGTEKEKNDHIKEILNARIEDEMDLSDGEEEKAESGTEKTPDNSDQQKSKLENESTKFCQELAAVQSQLQAAARDKAKLLHDMELKEEEIQALKTELAASTVEVENLKKRSSDEAALEEYCTFKRKDPSHSAENDHLDVTSDTSGVASTSSSAVTSLSAIEVRLVTWISTFLHVHPFGASIDYICSYLHQIDPSIQPSNIETLMRQCSATFREDCTGIGASLVKKWKYLGFDTYK